MLKLFVDAVVDSGFGLFFLISLFICQIGDVFLWGRPFAEFTEYIAYNLANKTTYAVRPWYMYFGTIGGLLLPPLSLFLYAGWSKVFKKKYNLMILIVTHDINDIFYLCDEVLWIKNHKTTGTIPIDEFKKEIELKLRNL